MPIIYEVVRPQQRSFYADKRMVDQMVRAYRPDIELVAHHYEATPDGIAKLCNRLFLPPFDNSI